MSRKRRRNHSPDFKLAALKQMSETTNIHALAEELGIERKLLYAWRDAYVAKGAAGLRYAGRPSAQAKADAALAALAAEAPVAEPARRIAELERKIGEQQMALDFFRAALRHVGDKRRASGVSGGTDSTK
ncbi:MAG: transposase [Rhizobiales bacterium]|nr:transposase [Hyphomicrobiales bacterium]